MKLIQKTLHMALVVSCACTLNAGSGDLDPTYGTNGVASTLVGTTGNGPGEIALRPGGGVVQIGVARNNSSLGSYGYDVAVVCYTEDGQLDTSFSGDGKLMTDINSNGNVYTDDRAGALLVQPDGKIIVGGTTRQYTKSGSASFEWYMWDLMLIRYLPNGDLDTDFANGGKMVLDVRGTGSTPEGFNDIALQSDGKIIGVGYIYPGNNRFLIGRFNADGTIDTSFGGSGNGLVEEHFSVNTLEDAYDMAILPDDSIIVVGRGIKSDGNHTFCVLKLTPDGALDSSFASGGKYTTTISTTSAAAVVTVDALGRIVVGGRSSAGSSADENLTLLRLNANGSVDTTFGTAGLVTQRLSDQQYHSMSGIVIHEDGQITSVATLRNPYEFGVVQWNEDGLLNLDFADSGMAVYSVESANYFSSKNALLLSDGSLLVGASVESADARFSVMKILMRDPWNSTFIALSGGWNQLSWFGMYTNTKDDWYYQTDMGHLQIDPESTPGDVLYYTPEDGWCWTCNIIFPWYYCYETGGWLLP